MEKLGKETLSPFKNKSVLSWALYDWANSAFATTILAGFFPVFFKDFWSQGFDAVTSTYYLGLGSAAAGFLVAITAPFLGTIADKAGYKKEVLFFFTLVGVLASLCLAFVPAGNWLLAIVVFGIGTFAFSSCMAPYDALLVDVTKGKKMDQVSGFGYALGYLGGGILFLVNVLMVQFHEIIGIESKSLAVQISFVSVAIWWAVFSVPIFRNVKEIKPTQVFQWLPMLRDSISEVLKTLGEIARHKALAVFLLAYFFYIEGVNTTVRMAVDYGMALGFNSSDLILALLIVQFVAFPFAILMGWLGEKIGAIKGIYLTLGVFIGISLLATMMTEVSEFYAMAVGIGAVLGGIQSLSRSYYAAQIPAAKSAEFFGFYNMLGKFSAVLGPLLIALVVKQSGDSRSASFVLLALFIMGGLFLSLSIRMRQDS